MTHVEELVGFVTRARHEDLSEAARERLKLHLLDTLGCAIGALDGGPADGRNEPVRYVREQVAEFGGTGPCSLIAGGQTAPDRASFHNGALVRYLDFMDSFLAHGETCHPSDNLAPVLAAAEYANADGRTFLTALAVAYEVQTRLAELGPLMEAGFDHTTHLAFSVPAGAAKALGL